MKILRDIRVTPYLQQEGSGAEAGIGDSIVLYLDQSYNSDFPVSITGQIVKLVKLSCGSSTSYSVEYDESNLTGTTFLRPEDVVDYSVRSTLDVLLNEEIKAQILALGLDAFTFENLQALREFSFSTLDVSVVSVASHTTLGDPGGGIWIWDDAFIGVASDNDWDDPENPGGVPLLVPVTISTVDDNGTFVKPNHISSSDPGRWRRVEALQNRERVKVSWFNADPIGTTFASAAIQAAHDALPIGTYGAPRRVHNLEDGSDTPAAAFKYLRRGTLELSSRAVYLLDDPLEISGFVIIEGNDARLELGNSVCVLSTPATAPNYGAASEEKFYIRFSKPFAIGYNNCFNTGIRNLVLLGMAESRGNTAASGIFVFGAQLSVFHNVSSRDFGFRSLVNIAVNMTGGCWIEGAMRGPNIDFTGGPGNTHEQLSIEHCNKFGLYIDPDTSRPYAALKLKNASKQIFTQIQFEYNPIDVEVISSQDIIVQRHYTSPIGGTVNGYPTYGVYFSGDSYNWQWPNLVHLDEGTQHLYSRWDGSLIAIGLGKQGLIVDRPAPSPPNFTVTAVADDNGTPVTTTVFRKSDSRGWFVTAPTATAVTSDCTITIAGKAREWCGQDSSFPGLYTSPFTEPASVLGELVVSRGSTDALSGRVQRYLLLGKGQVVALIADGADVTFGSNVPPAATITISNAADPTITIVAANTATCSTDISFNIQIK
jgi:hypothetical protein